ncbi:hypothetical protein Ancab_020209 [Ancistrocladus abbreviatus]
MQLEGVRILKGDLQSLMEKEEELLLLPALPRGKPPGSTSSPCTYIPGQNKGGKCTLKEMNVAGRRGGQGGHVVVPPTVLSELTVEVGGPDSASEDENGNAKRSS